MSLKKFESKNPNSKKEGEYLDSEALKKRYSKLENVKILGDVFIDKFNEKAPLTVYRYIRYCWAKEMIDSNIVSFANPKVWEDPFEKRFINGNYQSSGFAPKQLACFCVTTEHGLNEAAFWRGFDPDGQHDLVQLTLDFDVLLNSLDSFAGRHNATIYVKVCDYTYTSEQLKSSGKKSFLKNVDSLDEEGFINLMSLKRRAFASENELRLFVYGDNLSFENGYLKIPFEDKLVKTMKICPNPNREAFLSEEDIKLCLKKRFEEKNISIVNSLLYDKVPVFNFKKGAKT